MSELDSDIHEERVVTPVVDEKVLASEVRGVRFRDVGRRAGIAALLTTVVAGMLAFLAGRAEGVSPGEVAVMMAFVAVVSVIPVLLFYALIAAVRDRNGNRIYKRLKPGRQLSGVCLGLSEATGISVIIFRLAFIALTFAKGIGLFLYLLLDLAMPVHPDDRQYLLRFKLRRMWQRRFSNADHDAR